MNINHVFSIPVVTDQIDILVNAVDFIKNLKYIPYRSSTADITTVKESDCHLLISENKQVIDLPELGLLKDAVYKSAYNYWNNVLGVDYSIKLKTVHSWVTKHRQGHWNRPHAHTNSTFTSTIYLQVPNDSGDLVFKKDPHYLNLFPFALDFDYRVTNEINQTEFKITPKENDIVFFPSHLTHYTTENKNTQERFALNIDWWFYGTTRKGSGHGFESDF